MVRYIDMVLVNTMIFGWDMLSRLRALQWRFSSCFLFCLWFAWFEFFGGHYHIFLSVLFLLSNPARFLAIIQQRPARVPASLLRLRRGPGLSRQQGTSLITLPQHSEPSLAHHTTYSRQPVVEKYKISKDQIQKSISFKKLVSALQYAWPIDMMKKWSLSYYECWYDHLWGWCVSSRF